MTAQSKVTVKTYFERGDKPTQAQFVDLIDSYLDHSAVVQAIATVAATATGLIRTSAGTISVVSAGGVGLSVLSAVTTAAAQQSLGGGTVGRAVFEAATTAAVISTFRSDLVGAEIAQVVNTQTGAVATGSTQIPFDDSIPQNTEGDEYMTLSITPTNANSTLVIEVTWTGAHTGAADTPIVVALFQNSIANALAASVERMTVSNGELTVNFIHTMTAGTTSSTTFRVRAGAAVAGTTTFNGNSGLRRLGGVMASSITITEVLP